MSWSAEQRQAIEIRRKNLLVAAAAGSGKTSVLVERIIRRVLDTDNPVDIDKVLVVTFTNAAAAEMRARIGTALADALKADPRSRHIERQLVMLGSAAISTIHSFCQNIVRQHFHLLDLDPKFRIAGEAEINLLKADVLESLFEERYACGDSAFLQFVDHYGDEHSDDALYALVLGLYDFSRSHPWPDYWLGGLKEAFLLPPGTGIDDTPWSELIREKIVLELDQARHLLEALEREDAKPGNPAVYGETFTADRAVTDDLIAAAEHSWGRLAGAMACQEFGKLASAPRGTAKEIKDWFQKERQKVKDKVKKLKELFFSRPEGEMLADMRVVAPLVETLSGLVSAYGEKFAETKRSKGLVDFNDLEHFCLKILLAEDARPGEIKPSFVADILREKYAEVMVDEYQDTNGVQETILQLVARPDRPNLFLVGDVKQSIYRFRLAEPELFMEKYSRYPVMGEEYIRIDLAQNFRSRAGILHGVNFLFSQLMSPKVAGLGYGDKERLNPGPDYPTSDKPTLDGPVELCLIERGGRKDVEEIDGDTDGSDDESSTAETGSTDPAEDEAELSGFELESRLIVRRINELMAGDYQVYDKSTRQYRKLAWRDIVILLRSVKGKAGIILEELRQAGIPAYAEVDSGYFKEVEVQVMLSLLSIIDNPKQDIHLAGVLRSPVAGFTAAQLAEVRLHRTEGDLWSALLVTAYDESNADDRTQNALQQKALAFVTQLNHWRSFSRRKGVPELIWQIYRDTGYYDYAGGMPGGMLRQANLRALYDRARQYEATNFRGLFRFLRFIDRMQDKGSDLAVARALGESEDVVRVMSIHKSKGLEFPVVFVADLGKGFNLQDSNALVLCHKKLGVGPYVTNPELRFRYPTLARHGIAHKLNMEAKAEELRILYVALTRAREKLILVGSSGKLAQKTAEWCQMAGRVTLTLPDSVIAGAKCYLDWLCPAIARHDSGIPIREYGGCCEEAGGPLAVDPSQWKITIIQQDELAQPAEEACTTAPLLAQVRQLEPVAAGESNGWVEKALGWQYPFAQAVGKPAKLSVTEIKRRFEVLAEDSYEGGQQLFERPPVITRPRFMQEDEGLTAAELGTVMHTVMQHVNLSGDLSETGLVKQLQNMVAWEKLLPEQAAAVDIGAVAAFFAGSLGQRLCRSFQVRRELPFSLMLPAERFYPELYGSGEGIFVQGIIDVLFTEQDGLVLLDYKTDRVKSSAELIERYATQLNIYAEAVEEIFQQKVIEKYLYIFSTKESIKI